MRHATIVLVLSLSACDAPKKREPTAAPSKAAPKGFDYGKYASGIDALRKQLEKEPCQKKPALMLGEELNRAGDHDGAVAHVNAFTRSCGEWPRLLWVSQNAFETTGQWPKAVETGTALIRSEPSDSDYWWWRGQAQWKSGNFDQAEADLLQSMAAKPTGYPAARLRDQAREKQDYACAAAFLLQYLVEQSPKSAGDWAAKDRSDLWLKGNCSKLVGSGKTTIATPVNAPVVKAQVQLNGRKATFLVSREAGHTLVSRALATDAKLALKDFPGVTVWLAGEFVAAQLGTADSLRLGTATVKDLRVGVVEQLPEGIDGVLGLSALSRFSVRYEDGRIVLTPLES